MTATPWLNQTRFSRSPASANAQEAAVQAIMNLNEPKQMALGAALQRLMALAEAQERHAEPNVDASGKSNPPTPRTPREMTAYKSVADFLQDEIQEMKQQCKTEELAVEGFKNSEKALQVQLRAVMVDFAAEEEQAAETSLQIQKWQRSYGDEMRQRKAECQLLQQELHKETESAKDLPQQQLKLQRHLDSELDACCQMQDTTDKLEVELREAAQSNENDDLSTVKAEMMASQMQQTVVDRKLRRADAEEKEQMALAKTTWEKLHLAEVAASNQEQSLRQVRRTAEKEEECEADVLGLLEFRECEMRQVELSLGEADTASPPSTRDSVAGPGVELMRSAPDVAELRVLLKELGHIARKNSSAQSELSQQQQRTRDLAHRLQQLENEASAHRQAEAIASVEYKANCEEAMNYASECREHNFLVQSEVKHAQLEQSQMEGTKKRNDEEVAEMQKRLVTLRGQATSRRKDVTEVAANLAAVRQVISKSEAASSLLREQQLQRKAREDRAAWAAAEATSAAEELQRLEQQLERCTAQREEQLQEEDVQELRVQELQKQELLEQQQREECEEATSLKQEELFQHQRRVEQQRQVLEDLKQRSPASPASPASSRLDAGESLEPPDVPDELDEVLEAQAAPSLSPEQAGTAAAAAQRAQGASLEEQCQAAADAAHSAAERRGAAPPVAAAAAAAAAGAAAATAKRAEKKDAEEQVQAARTAAAAAARAHGGDEVLLSAAAAGAAAAAAARSAKKPLQLQAQAAATAAADAAHAASPADRGRAAADAAASAALVGAKIAGKSKKEQVQLSASSALAAAEAAGMKSRSPELDRAVRAAAEKAASSCGWPNDKAQQIASEVLGTDRQEAGEAKGKVVLKKLRQQLAEQERKLRQWEAAQLERRRAMGQETQLISDSIREIGIRCQMLVGKHRVLLDDRKRLEAEA
ncbi:unnamed protein product [Durusdinium trenchii]|uniref:Centrosomal protein of 162 kDa n=1 Tax=Durusdinium trenchii TaxID=1381693 RepID=A0ABP0KF87_9DINO